MNNLKVLLTGNTGLVGSMIQLKLKESCELYTLGRGESNNFYDDKRFFKIDLRNNSKLNKLIKKISPDIIIHCAAQTPGDIYPDSKKLAINNEQIDTSLFKSISKTSCKLIYMSSTIVYGLPKFEYNVDESFPVMNYSYYASQKINAEKYILKNFKNFLILRLNAPYGLNMRNDTVMTKFINQSINNKPILLHGSGNRMQDFTNSKDIAELIYNLLKDQNRNKGVFNISNGMPISMKDLAYTIKKITGSNSEVLYSGLLDEQEDYKASYSTNMAKNLLNWKPQISLESGILELISNFSPK